MDSISETQLCLLIQKRGKSFSKKLLETEMQDIKDGKEHGANVSALMREKEIYKHI